MSHEIAFGDGLLAAKAGKRVLARIQFEQADELSPNDPDTAMWLAWTADSPEQAVEILGQAVKSSPDNELLWAFKSVLEKLQNFEAGHDYADFFVELIDAPTLAQQNEEEESNAAKENVVDQATARVETSELAEEESDVQDHGGEEASPEYFESEVQEDVHPEELHTDAVATYAGDESEEPFAVEATTSDEKLEHSSEFASRSAIPEDFTDPFLSEDSVATIGGDVAKRGEAAETGETPHVEATKEQESESLCEADEFDHHAAEPSLPETVASETETADEEDPADEDLEAAAEAVIDQVAEIQEDVDQALTSESDSDLASSAAPEPSPQAEHQPQEQEPVVPAEEPAAESPNAANTVLVVDDSPTVLKLVSMTLSAGGYEVQTAANGIEAMKMLVNFTPALILLDVNMPRMDGYKLCKLIKRHEKMKYIPVVMLSGKDGMFDKLRGTLVGCNDYITKPFESADLLKQVEKYIGVSTN